MSGTRRHQPVKPINSTLRIIYGRGFRWVWWRHLNRLHGELA